MRNFGQHWTKEQIFHYANAYILWVHKSWWGRWYFLNLSDARTFKEISFRFSSLENIVVYVTPLHILICYSRVQKSSLYLVNLIEFQQTQNEIIISYRTNVAKIFQYLFARLCGLYWKCMLHVKNVFTYI